MVDDNLAIIQRVYDAMKNRDATVMQELFAEEITIRQGPEVPWGGEYVARKAPSPSSCSWSSTSNRR